MSAQDANATAQRADAILAGQAIEVLTSIARQTRLRGEGSPAATVEPIDFADIVVRGHWRRHWYPSLGGHRPLWIAPYLKGPADAPLLGGDKVTIVAPPAPREPAE